MELGEWSKLLEQLQSIRAEAAEHIFVVQYLRNRPASLKREKGSVREKQVSSKCLDFTGCVCFDELVLLKSFMVIHLGQGCN